MSKNTLQGPGVGAIGQRGRSDREVINVRENQTFWDRDVEGHDIDNEQQGRDWRALGGTNRDGEKRGASPGKADGRSSQRGRT